MTTALWRSALDCVSVSCSLRDLWVFADNETDHRGRSAALKGRPDCALGTWSGVKNVEEAVSSWLPIEQLDDIVQLGAHLAQRPIDSFRKQVGEKAGNPGDRRVADLVGLVGESQARSALASAMQAGSWFKTVDRGHALGEALIKLGVPSQIQTSG